MPDKPRCINLTNAEVREILANGRIILRRKIKRPLIDKNVGCELAPCELGTEEIAEMSPLGAPGHELVGRETWAHYHIINSVVKSTGVSYAEVSDGLCAYKGDGYGSISDLKQHLRLICGADLEEVEVKGNRWQSPATMPFWAYRLRLVTRAVSVDVAAGEWVGGLERIEVKA